MTSSPHLPDGYVFMSKIQRVEMKIYRHGKKQMAKKALMATFFFQYKSSFIFLMTYFKILDSSIIIDTTVMESYRNPVFVARLLEKYPPLYDVQSMCIMASSTYMYLFSSRLLHLARMRM